MCGECGRPGSGVSLRELESGEIAASASPTPPIAAEWATTAEVAARHRLSTKTIRKAIASGALEAVGSKHQPYRIKREAEQAWIASRREGGARQTRHRKGRKAASGTTFRDMARKP